MKVVIEGKDILVVYGLLKREIKRCEDLKASPSCPISKQSLNKNIRLHQKILQVLEDQCPALKTLPSQES